MMNDEDGDVEEDDDVVDDCVLEDMVANYESERLRRASSALSCTCMISSLPCSKSSSSLFITVSRNR